MEVDAYGLNRVQKLKDFIELVNYHCKGVQTDVEKVKMKTDEEFHFWLEDRIKSARREQAAYKKAQPKKRGN